MAPRIMECAYSYIYSIIREVYYVMEMKRLKFPLLDCTMTTQKADAVDEANPISSSTRSCLYIYIDDCFVLMLRNIRVQYIKRYG